MSPLQTYYDDDGDLVFDSADGNTYIVDETNPQELAAYEQQEAAYQQDAEFYSRLNSHVELKERRMGRELTEAEFQGVMQNLDPYSLDVEEAYAKAYPTDRAADEEQRQALMAETMEDVTAQQEAAEAGEQNADVLSEGYE
jgi:hypothetical protein